MVTFNNHKHGRYVDVLEKYKHLKITAEDLETVANQ